MGKKKNVWAFKISSSIHPQEDVYCLTYKDVTLHLDGLFADVEDLTDIGFSSVKIEVVLVDAEEYSTFEEFEL
jgi:hypothetical protein